MLSKWENQFRQHWPHHYRDVLEKLDSPFGMVAVNDVINPQYSPENTMVTLEKTFEQPTTYKLTVLDSGNGKAIEMKQYGADDLSQSLEDFLSIIGGWQTQNYSSQ